MIAFSPSISSDLHDRVLKVLIQEFTATAS